MPLSLRLVTSLALLSSIRPAASPKVQPSLAASSTTPRAPRRAYHTSFQQQQRAYGGSGSVNSMAPPLSYPRPTVIEPKAGGQPSAAVFIMHGLGDTAVSLCGFHKERGERVFREVDNLAAPCSLVRTQTRWLEEGGTHAPSSLGHTPSWRA